MTVARIQHITNGSAIIPKMRDAGLDGPILSWDDVLHEGPVPAGLNIGALRDVRAEFLASWAHQPFDVIARSFRDRDNAVDASIDAVDEVVLWLEHDLYDQLQLIQILDRFPLDRGPLVTAVPDDDYLGTQPTPRFAGLFTARTEVTTGQRLAARDAWQCFRASDPRTIVDVLPRVTALRHLPAALRRHLQQFPSLENGLSRTEQQTLEAAMRGVTHVKDLYTAANHEREEAVFMGDAAFLFHIEALTRPPRPLLQVEDDRVVLTADGRRVHDGDADRVRLCGIDRWLGGVHLEGAGPMWRWDATRQTIRLV